MVDHDVRLQSARGGRGATYARPFRTLPDRPGELNADGSDGEGNGGTHDCGRYSWLVVVVSRRVQKRLALLRTGVTMLAPRLVTSASCHAHAPKQARTWLLVFLRLSGGQTNSSMSASPQPNTPSTSHITILVHKTSLNCHSRSAWDSRTGPA